MKENCCDGTAGLAGSAAVRSRALILATVFQGHTMNQFTASTAPAPRRTHRLAAISAGWHREIVVRARDAFLAELAREGWPPDQVDSFDVPGVFEIPLLARRLAQSGRYEAVVAFGLIVNGGIYRHDFVSRSVIDGLMQAQLDSGVPVLSAVLTPHHFHEHDEHRRYFGEHFVVKGAEAAQAALRIVALHRDLDTLERVDALA
jgi:6,7-dimethyl-8-ribityllumazine synthase